MVNRRGFLALCGAGAAAAVLPEMEASGTPKTKVFINDIDVSKYVRPGAYITVPEYTYAQETSLRTFYQYLALLDRSGAVAPGIGPYYDKLVFTRTYPADRLIVSGRTNIPMKKLSSMWELAERAAQHSLRPSAERAMKEFFDG